MLYFLIQINHLGLVLYFKTFRRLHNWLPKSTSEYKYKQNFKLNNCANAKNPQAQPLMQTAVVYSVVFSRT